MFEWRLQEVFTAAKMGLNRFICSLLFLAESHINLRKCSSTCETELFLKFPTPEQSASQHFRSILKFKKCSISFAQKTQPEKIFSQKFRYLPESK